MKIFKDKKLTKEIENETFDFGIVLAGETKQFEFWVLNDSNAYLRMLEFKVERNEVKVVEAPTELQAQASGKLLLEWSPSITIKEGLKAPLRISGIELWGGG